MVKPIKLGLDLVALSLRRPPTLNDRCISGCIPLKETRQELAHAFGGEELLLQPLNHLRVEQSHWHIHKLKYLAGGSDLRDDPALIDDSYNLRRI